MTRWRGLLLGALLVVPGCATRAERQMLPVERVVTYTETADYAPVGAGQPGAEAELDIAKLCKQYRQTIENYNEATAVGMGITGLGVIVSFLTDNDKVKEAAQTTAIAGTLSQASSATAAHMTAEEAREFGCTVP